MNNDDNCTDQSPFSLVRRGAVPQGAHADQRLPQKDSARGRCGELRCFAPRFLIWASLLHCFAPCSRAISYELHSFTPCSRAKSYQIHCTLSFLIKLASLHACLLNHIILFRSLSSLPVFIIYILCAFFLGMLMLTSMLVLRLIPAAKIPLISRWFAW